MLLVFGTLTRDDITSHPSALPGTADEYEQLSHTMRTDWVGLRQPRCAQVAPPVSRQAPALHVSTAPTRPIAPTRRNRRADSGLTTDSTRSICLSDGSRTDTFLRLHRKLRAAVRQPTDAVQARTSRSLRFGCATHQMPHAI